MALKIILLPGGEDRLALIREGKPREIPSLHDNWYFDLAKQLKRLRSATAYVLVKEESPEVMEGCMIFQLVDNEMPVMAYLEVAPHNKGKQKQHDRVAGCLIAYAYKLSVIRGSGHYKGVLSFRVGEEKKEDEEKLIKLYQTKYYAVRIGDSLFLEIADEAGERLVKEYLDNG